MSGHTKRPWVAFYKSKYDEWHVAIPCEQGSFKLALADDGILPDQPLEVREYYARRIVACVNALEGLDPAAVADVVAALEEVTSELSEFAEITINGFQDDNLVGKVTRARTALARIRGEG